MMGLIMPETCWTYKKYNKIISGIWLVFYSSVITMMHGPTHIKLNRLVCSVGFQEISKKNCKIKLQYSMRSSNSLYHGYLFSLSSVPVGSVVKRMALGKVYLTQLPHFLLNIIAPVLHASPTIYHARHKIVQCTTSLTLQRGVTSTARHSVNITCRGVTSPARHAARSHSFVYISTS